MVIEYLVLIVSVYIIWFIFSTKRERRDMPPGPFPLPFIGNSHQLGSNPPLTSEGLRKKYGDIYTVTTPIGLLVMVNSSDMAKEVLSGRNADFANRLDPLSFPANIVSSGNNIVLSNYGPRYVFKRKMVVSAIHVFGEGLQAAETRVDKEIEQLLKRFEAKGGRPFEPTKHIFVTSMNMILEWMLSKRFDFGNPTSDMLLDFTEKFNIVLRQGSYYQLLPFLKYFPTEFNEKLKNFIQTRDSFFGKNLLEHLQTFDKNNLRDIADSFIATIGEKNIKMYDGEVPSEGMCVMMDIFVASSETSRTTLTWFVFHMLTYPDVQAKVREEIDRVVGRDRMPQWKDAPNLPYTLSALAESMRHSLAVTVLPRRAMCDSSIAGYRIPKDCSVFVNLCQVHMDPIVFKDPHSFKPERFINSDGTFFGWNAPSFYPFGGGRRSCVGPTLGKMMIVLVVSRMLQRFVLKVPENETLSSDFAVVSGVLSPKPFKMIAIKRT